MDINGILRCRGRLENAGIPESAKQPILLPKHNRYTDLVIDMYHRKALHTGIAQTLSLIRQKYWILHGRSAVGKVLGPVQYIGDMKEDHTRCPLCHHCQPSVFQNQHHSHILESIILAPFISKQKEIGRRYGFLYLPV